MKYQVLLTKNAEQDLKSIYEYIKIIICEPEIALKQLDRIERGIRSLETMPHRFKIFEQEPWCSRGLRQMPIDNFVAFYIPNIANHEVAVIRILHGRMDIDKQLFKVSLI